MCTADCWVCFIASTGNSWDGEGLSYGTELLKELSARLTEEFGRGFDHESVKHKTKEYSKKGKDGGKVTTNTVESSFALLKRGIVGAFHHVSKEHLHRYTAEFDFRWNHRKSTDGERTDQAMSQTSGKRLCYKAPKVA